MASQILLAAIAFDHAPVGELVEMGRTRGAQAELAEWSSTTSCGVARIRAPAIAA